MNITTLPFMLFMLLGAIVYYVIPKRIQWIWLLVMSCAFYWIGGKEGVAYILFTCLTIWGGAIGITKIQNEKKKKLVYRVTLIANLAILIVIKGLLFASAMDLIEGRLSAVIMPLSLSFYTLTAASYMTDVYWEKIEPEKNPARLLLYLSYFPQVVQGPIARYGHLGEQFKKPHKFDIDNLEAGLLRIIWGFFKKAVIADRLVGAVSYIFDEGNYRSAGFVFFGAVLYAIQQYGDFSGGIDIITGVAKIYDIEITPNFERPYFSKSLGEFWRRWHISLGAWMKDYVFYPFSVSQGTRKLSKWAKNKWSKQAGKVLPVVLGNLLVFLLVGLWHGYYLHFIVWGIYNGVVIAFSAAMEPVYKTWRAFFKITDKTKWFNVFQVVRTFLIFVMGGIFDRAVTMKDSITMWRMFFVGPYREQSSFYGSLAVSLNCFDFGKFDVIFIVIAILILFGCELYEEITGKSVRESVMGLKLPLRWLILISFIYFVIAAHVDLGANTEFLYGGF